MPSRSISILTSQPVFFGTSALLFVVSTVVTILWCASMSTMCSMTMPGGWSLSMTWMRMPDQSWFDVATTFLCMWTVMMVAMMLPSLLPMLLTYREAITEGRAALQNSARLGQLTVLAGVAYFVVWTALGIAIFPFGVALTQLAMQMPVLARTVPLMTAAVIVIAGALQFSAWKARQLTCCRSMPRSRRVLSADFASAWRYGLNRGLQCVHCCAGPTLVLLVLGVMDLWAMSIVAAAITLERLAPAGEQVARGIGAAAVMAGAAMMAQAVSFG
jgi:predicted metal-binding membrane protein